MITAQTVKELRENWSRNDGLQKALTETNGDLESC